MLHATRSNTMYKNKKEAWAAMPRLKKKVVGIPLKADVEITAPRHIDVETIKPTLAFLSKFPTLLFYKMMGITPLMNNIIDWNAPILLQIYIIFLKVKLMNYINVGKFVLQLTCVLTIKCKVGI